MMIPFFETALILLTVSQRAGSNTWPMPDVWTKHPEILMDGVRSLGAKCGQEPRILKPRDPAWTCYLDSPGVIRDIYIHRHAELYTELPFLLLLAGAMLIGLLLGYFGGKRADDRRVEDDL